MKEWGCIKMMRRKFILLLIVILTIFFTSCGKDVESGSKQGEATENIFYTVEFWDNDGVMLKTEQVKSGASATAPADPTRDGYTFTGWDKTFNNVTEDMTVTAVYTELANVTFTFSYDIAKAGEELLLTLSVRSKESVTVNGLIAYSLQYDNTVVEFIGFESYGELVTSSTAGTNSIHNGIINLGYTNAINANGDICQLRFTVKENVMVGTQSAISMLANASKGGQAISDIISPTCIVTITD